jgi:Spy/CpxP family protein refolding chaperone
MNGRPGVVAAVMLFLSFLVGGLAGMAAEEAMGLDWFDFLDEDNQEAEGRILEGLGLSEDQTDRIAEILETQEDRLEEYWEGRVPEMRAIVAASYDRIREVLTDEQRGRFDERIRAQGVPPPRDPD